MADERRHGLRTNSPINFGVGSKNKVVSIDPDPSPPEEQHSESPPGQAYDEVNNEVTPSAQADSHAAGGDIVNAYTKPSFAAKFPKLGTNFFLSKASVVKWMKRILALAVLLGCVFAGVTLWPSFVAERDGHEALKYAQWESKKNFVEFCTDETTRSFSPSCNLTSNYTLSAPPQFLEHVKRELAPVIRSVRQFQASKYGLPIAYRFLTQPWIQIAPATKQLVQSKLGGLVDNENLTSQAIRVYRLINDRILTQNGNLFIFVATALSIMVLCYTYTTTVRLSEAPSIPRPAVYKSKFCKGDIAWIKDLETPVKVEIVRKRRHRESGRWSYMFKHFVAIRDSNAKLDSAGNAWISETHLSRSRP